MHIGEGYKMCKNQRERVGIRSYRKSIIKTITDTFDENISYINPEKHPLRNKITDEAKQFVQKKYNEYIGQCRVNYLSYQGRIGGTHHSKYNRCEGINNLIKYDEKGSDNEDIYGETQRSNICKILGDILKPVGK